MRWFKKDQTAPPREVVSSVPMQPAHRPDWHAFDDVAGDYARAVAPHFAPIAADLVAFAEIPASGKLLDVGTGTGVVLRAAGSFSSFGVDPSVPMLRHAQGLNVVAAETHSLPFRAETFHGATIEFVLPMFPKLDTALFDVVRVLRPGGVLAAATWDAGEDELTKTWRELAERAIGEKMMREEMRDAEPWALVAEDKDRLEQALRDAGLHPVTVERRKYKLTMSRDDYVTEKTTQTSGRFVRAMLADEWPQFLESARATYAKTFPETLVDFRDVLLARGTKP
ncbi:MAG TPA: class I SAM-dependent methyltransferase [Actinomycetota bacterium]|nr:class I SAM-dependent methyltransferase [Actinomycetota bacterium]